VEVTVEELTRLIVFTLHNTYTSTHTLYKILILCYGFIL
jgi:hypothetical protein